MSLRGFIGAVIGGSIGLAQFCLLVYLDSTNPDSNLPANDFVFWIFAATWVFEMVALMAIGMYRIAPWVTRVLGDSFETYWILKEKKKHYSLIIVVAAITVLIRAIVRVVDTGSLSQSAALGFLFAALPFVLPSPKVDANPFAAAIQDKK